MRENFGLLVLAVPALLMCGVAAKAGPITLDNFSLTAGSATASGPNRAVLVREPVNGYLVTIESCPLGVCNTPIAPPLTTQSQPSTFTLNGFVYCNSIDGCGPIDINATARVNGATSSQAVALALLVSAGFGAGATVTGYGEVMDGNGLDLRQAFSLTDGQQQFYGPVVGTTNGIPTTLSERFHVDGVPFGQHVNLPFGSTLVKSIGSLDATLNPVTNPSTGGTPVTPPIGGTPAATPEPSAGILVAFGLMGIVFRSSLRRYLVSSRPSGLSKSNPNSRGFSPITAADTI